MKVGDIVPTRYISSSFINPKAKGSFGYKAEKGKNMLFLYLGQEPIDGSQSINPAEILKRLGWTQGSLKQQPPKGEFTKAFRQFLTICSAHNITNKAKFELVKRSLEACDIIDKLSKK